MEPENNLTIKLGDIDLNDKNNFHPLLKNGNIDDCEEAVTSDSEEYLSEPLNRYQQFLRSTSSDMSTVTLMPDISRNEESFFKNGREIEPAGIDIPIVGYEVMEERARFTVYKLRIENKSNGDCWYVFRRYTDFVRLCNRLKHKYPHIVQHLPRKRFFRNNFDPVFLEMRVSSLQTLVNAIINEPELINSILIQEFFCLNEPPVYSETNEESRAIFEALEDTIFQLKQQLIEKDSIIDSLEDKLQSKVTESENLKKIISNSTMNCQKCQKDCKNISKMLG